MPRTSPSLDFDAARPAPQPLLAKLFSSRLKLRMRLLICFGLAVMVVVPVNALFLQEGRHPAPLFRLASLRPDHPRAVAPASLQRPAAAAPARIENAKSEPAKTEGARKANAGPDLIAQLIDGRLSKKEAKPRRGKDAIADEIAHRDGDKTVAFAQRALVKLGYALHEDGVFSGTTRQALEKFERANGMPVTGELTAKVLKLLGQRSGLAMR